MGSKERREGRIGREEGKEGRRKDEEERGRKEGEERKDLLPNDPPKDNFLLEVWYHGENEKNSHTQLRA